MPRVQVHLPETFVFSTDIPLYLIHINKGGHLDYAMLLTIASEARGRFIKHLGFDTSGPEGAAMFVVDTAVQYLSEGHYGDVMRVELAVADLGRKSCDIVWRMSQADESGREVARGKMGHVFVDRATRKPVEVPAEFRERC